MLGEDYLRWAGGPIAAVVDGRYERGQWQWRFVLASGQSDVLWWSGKVGVCVRKGQHRELRSSWWCVSPLTACIMWASALEGSLGSIKTGKILCTIDVSVVES